MPMEEAQVEKLRTWFEVHGWPICLRCNLQPGRDSEWDIGDIVSLIPSGGDETGPRYEVVFVACGHCGYVAQYMAQMIGLKATPRPDPQTKPQPQQRPQPQPQPQPQATPQPQTPFSPPPPQEPVYAAAPTAGEEVAAPQTAAATNGDPPARQRAPTRRRGRRGRQARAQRNK